MKDILVYLLDPAYGSDLRGLFPRERYKVTVLEDLEAVLEAFQQDLFDAAIVWAATRDKTANFLTALEVDQFEYIPVIAVADSDAERTALADLGVVEIIPIPIPRLAFFRILEAVLSDVETESTVEEGLNWQGSLSEYGLVDLIQMIEAGQRDAELILSYGDHRARVWFRKGRLIDARLGDISGMAAIRKLAFLGTGQFQSKQTELSEDLEQRIDASNQDVLFSLVEQVVRETQMLDDLPDLDSPILKNPLVKPESPTDLQTRIMEACQNPVTILDLLLSLSDPNDAVLGDLKALVERGAIGPRDEIEAQVAEERGRSGFGKLFSSLSSIFKKREEEEWGEYVYADVEDEALEPRIDVGSLELDADARHRIVQTLDERLR